MQYDLVVADMDGTLLRDDKTLSERTLRAIRRYQDAGGHFTIATGRCYEGTGRYMKDLDLRSPYVLLNGCLVHDPTTGADILCRRLPVPVLEQIWPVLEEHGLNVVVYDPRKATTRAMNEMVAEHQRHDGIGLVVAPDLGPTTLGDMVKVLTIAAPSILDRVEAIVTSTKAQVRMVRSYPHYLEFLPESGGKGAALEALRVHLGIPRERTMAIGDGLNDLDLLQAAGCSVAMANAHPAVKAVADRLTTSNMEDGVAHVLEGLVE